MVVSYPGQVLSPVEWVCCDLGGYSRGVTALSIVGADRAPNGGCGELHVSFQPLTVGAASGKHFLSVTVTSVIASTSAISVARKQALSR